MDENPKNIVIGTAGHVDHGKTTLVKALTGIDTDRLKEEKERGMTIEPGFAFLKLPSGRVVSIVDVPGHERLIRNMLRGISEVDAVLLVVAADDGVMPQTREHLDILRLLGIEHGLVILSKIDLVDQETLEMAKDEIAHLLQGMFLEAAPLLPYSSKTGEGIDEIKKSIEHLLQKVEGKNREGLFRLPIDRVFTLAGYGTVVTGTIVAGKIAQGDEVEICPLGLRTTVRSLQVHNQFVLEAFAGQRVGVNLTNIKVETLKRGMVLSQPGTFIPAYIINGTFHYLKSNVKPLLNQSKIKFYSGTSEIIARLILIGKEMLHPGESTFVQLRLFQPSPLCPYDRYIIRSLSPINTIGGGMVLEVNARKYKPHHHDTVHHLEALKMRNHHEAIERFIEKEKFRPIPFSELSKRFGVPLSEITTMMETLAEDQRLMILEGQMVFHRKSYERLKKELVDTIETFHTKNPLANGASQEEVRSKISPILDHLLFEKILQDLLREGRIALHKGRVRLNGFQRKLTPEQKRIYDQLDSVSLSYGFRPLPSNVLQEILDRVGAKEGEAVLKLMVGEGRLIKLNNGRLMHADAMEKIKKILKERIQEKGQVALGESTELLGIGRTQAQPIFEYLDASRFTMRIGDHRILYKTSEGKD